MILLPTCEQQPQPERNQNYREGYPDVLRIKLDYAEDPQQQPYTDDEEQNSTTDSGPLIVFLHAKSKF